MELHSVDASFDQGIDMKLALREDIGAELDDFLLLSLLGIDDEARESVRVILWRHLRYFPVFAEVADYVIERNEKILQRQLLQTIQSANIDFAHRDEATFLRTIVRILGDEHTAASEWREDIRTGILVGFCDWYEPELVRFGLYARTVAYPINSTPFLEISVFLCRRYLTRGLTSYSVNYSRSN